MSREPYVPSDLHKALAKRVKAGLVSEGITQRELGVMSGVGIKMLNGILNGRRGASVKAWDRILKAVGREFI